jgi:hypothetical protein
MIYSLNIYRKESNNSEHFNIKNNFQKDFQSLIKVFKKEKKFE